MTRNKAISGTDALGSILDAVAARLPEGWSVQVLEAPRAIMGQPDALLKLRANGGPAVTLAIEFKSRLEPRDVIRIPEQSESPGREPWLVAAPFLSLRTRQLLEARRLSYADSTGNVRIVVRKPPLVIFTRGAERDPWRQPQPLRSLKGPVAGRVVRALCDFRPPFGVRELAERSRTSLGSVSRVVALLDGEARIERQGRGPIVSVDWQGVLRRWCEEYSWSQSNRLTTWLAPRGITKAATALAGTDVRCAITGSFVASNLAPVAAPRLLSVYAENPTALAAAADLKPADAGANVVIAEPFDPVVFDRTSTHDGVVYAALTQVAADLLTGPGRSPAEGEALLRWMKENEPAWRAE